jgi:hypothetical protein
MSPAPDLDGLSNADLKRLVLELLGRVTELERLVAAQREEIARLKNLKGRPTIKPGTPSGMDTHTTSPGSSRKPGRRGRKASQLTIHEERVMRAAVPAGSRFKGYEDFLIQDLIVRSHGIRIRRERWLTRMAIPSWRRCLMASSGILGRTCAATCWRSTIRVSSPSRGWSSISLCWAC